MGKKKRSMEKQNVVCTHKRVLFGFKRKLNSDTCYNMNQVC